MDCADQQPCLVSCDCSLKFARALQVFNFDQYEEYKELYLESITVALKHGILKRPEDPEYE